MSELVTWRLLFDMLQFRIVAPLLQAVRTGRPLNVPDHRAIAESALMAAANALRAADLAGVPDTDVMWRYWSDLFSYGEPVGEPHMDEWLYLKESHAQATTVLLAWYLHVAVADGTQRETAERALRATQRRIDLLGHIQGFLARVQAMTPDREHGIAGQLWHEWTREEMPERQTVMIESVPTALERLLIFWTLLHGPGPHRTEAEWARFIQEEEISRLSRQLLEKTEVAGISVGVTPEMVVDQFKAFRKTAEQAHAVWLVGQQLDDTRISYLRSALERNWVKSRALPGILEAAGADVSFDPARFAQLSRDLPKDLFVSETNMVGEEWLGADIGRMLGLLEARTAVVHWRNLGQEVPSDWTVERLMQAVADTGARAGVLLLPYDWQVEEWEKRNRSLLAGFNVQAVSTTVMLENEAMLVIATHEAWRIGRDEDVRFQLEGVPLKLGATQAVVRAIVEYPEPVPDGLVSCWLAPTTQLTGIQPMP